MSELIRVEGLKKYFKTPRGNLHAVDDVNFSLEEGHTLGVVGESGCGKSTLGRVLIHLLEPTAGKIFFEGKDISKVEPEQLKALREDMQMIFQDPYASLNPRMDVFTLIAEPLRIYNKFSNERDLEARVMQLMKTVGLEPRFANYYPHELDGGRRQRIGVARALALEPKFIVCDEPVSALDVSIQAQIINLLQDLQEELGLTLLFITHDMSVVNHISDRIMVMYLGMVVEFADTKQLFREPLHPYTQALLAAVPIPSINVKRERQLLTGEISSPVNPRKECRFSKRCPYVQDICRKEVPPLEEKRPGHFAACFFAGNLKKKETLSDEQA